MNPKVDHFLEEASQWKDELSLMRKIILEIGLTEDFKWMHPCYTLHGKNVVLLHGFKEYCALLFYKGALLDDPEKILVQQTANVQAARQLRFRSAEEILDRERVIKSYLREAIAVEKAGRKVKMKTLKEFEVPEELELKFRESPEFKKAFESMTPGRQKAYLLHFSGAKQSNTRTSRIEKNTDRIMMGKGLTDCICGLSKRMPGCDGSHKHL